MLYSIEIINQLGVAIILALSLNAIVGMTGMLTLGHAGFFAVGAYTAGLLAMYTSHPAWGYLNFALGAGGAMLAAALCAVAIGLPCLRLSGDYLAIATLGFGEVVRLVLLNLTFPGTAASGGEPFGGATGITLPTTADYIHTSEVNPFPEGPLAGLFAPLQNHPLGTTGWLAGATELLLNTWLTLLCAALTFVLLLRLKRSAIGRAFLAIREDEIAARAMGVNVPWYKLLAFLLCAAFAGLAGALYASAHLSLAPSEFSLMTTMMVLLAVVLGGLGSYTGSALAAVVLVGVPELLRLLPSWLARHHHHLSFDPAKYQQIIFALLLILLVRFVPNGLLGMRELPDLWRRRRPPPPAAEAPHG